jgi:hypothetical protein
MKKIIIIGILVLTMAMAVPAMAFEKGTIRLGAGTGGSGFSTTTLDRDAAGDFDIDVIAIGGGYFLTDVIELTLDFANVDLGGSDFNSFGLGGRYHFPMGENSLYAGGGFQMLEFGPDDGDAIFITGGYNYMFRDYFSIDFYLTYGQGRDFDLTDLGITYSIYFK